MLAMTFAYRKKTYVLRWMRLIWLHGLAVLVLLEREVRRNMAAWKGRLAQTLQPILKTVMVWRSWLRVECLDCIAKNGDCSMFGRESFRYMDPKMASRP